jgi:hypothetical protein
VKSKSRCLILTAHFPFYQNAEMEEQTLFILASVSQTVVKARFMNLSRCLQLCFRFFVISAEIFAILLLPRYVDSDCARILEYVMLGWVGTVGSIFMISLPCWMVFLAKSSESVENLQRIVTASFIETENDAAPDLEFLRKTQMDVESCAGYEFLYEVLNFVESFLFFALITSSLTFIAIFLLCFDIRFLNTGEKFTFTILCNMGIIFWDIISILLKLHQLPKLVQSEFDSIIWRAEEISKKVSILLSGKTHRVKFRGQQLKYDPM